jgi:CO dehydrogenase/acetyl-CoA synthase delta subunit
MVHTNGTSWHRKLLAQFEAEIITIVCVSKRRCADKDKTEYNQLVQHDVLHLN